MRASAGVFDVGPCSGPARGWDPQGPLWAAVRRHELRHLPKHPDSGPRKDPRLRHLPEHLGLGLRIWVVARPPIYTLSLEHPAQD